MIERHLRVKDLGGASGLLPNTPFILLIREKAILSTLLVIQKTYDKEQKILLD